MVLWEFHDRYPDFHSKSWRTFAIFSKRHYNQAAKFYQELMERESFPHPYTPLH